MLCRNSKEQRQMRYAVLRKCVEEKGRIPFRKENQKHAKLMMFMYETLYDMANKSFMQNNDGVLYKIHFTNTYNISSKEKYSGKVILEYGIASATSRFRAFEMQHMSQKKDHSTLQSF